MRRHERSDARWTLIADLLPCAGLRGGGRWRDHRQVVNGLMWKRAPGARRRDLPERHGPWQAICERFSRWRREGLFDRLPDRLRLGLNTEGLIGLDLRCIGSPSVRASRSAAGAGKKGIPRSRSPLRSASRAAASAPGSTWRAREAACPWPSRLPPRSGTRGPPSSGP
jgi:transposase